MQYTFGSVFWGVVYIVAVCLSLAVCGLWAFFAISNGVWWLAPLPTPVLLLCASVLVD